MEHLESTKKRALRILGKRNMSAQEMKKRLTDKSETQEDADEAVAWLVELGYINDEDFAKQIVRHYSAKGYGPARIKDELFKRGIPRDLWDDALTGFDENKNADAALELLKKKLKGSRDKDDLRRATETLVRRGNSYEDANSAVKRYLEEMDDET